MDPGGSFLDMYGLSVTVPNEGRNQPKPLAAIELEPSDESSSDEEIGIEYITENCPKTSVVREFMKANIKNKDEPDWLHT